MSLNETSLNNERLRLLLEDIEKRFKQARESGVHDPASKEWQDLVTEAREIVDMTFKNLVQAAQADGPVKNRQVIEIKKALRDGQVSPDVAVDMAFRSGLAFHNEIKLRKY